MVGREVVTPSSREVLDVDVGCVTAGRSVGDDRQVGASRAVWQTGWVGVAVVFELRFVKGGVALSFFEGECLGGVACERDCEAASRRVVVGGSVLVEFVVAGLVDVDEVDVVAGAAAGERGVAGLSVEAVVAEE